jgi:hypothetical protein
MNVLVLIIMQAQKRFEKFVRSFEVSHVGQVSAVKAKVNPVIIEISYISDNFDI